MSLRGTRLAPLSLRRALLLLVPLALLGTALMGLLAQSASAEHGTPAPALVGPATPDDLATPRWSFLTPAAESDPGEPVYSETDAATHTVDIERSYATECVYGSAPASADDFAGAAICSVVFAPAVNTYEGAVTTDGTYVLSVRTVETTTTTTTTDDGVNPPTTGAPVTSTSYSAIESEAYVYDTTPPVVTVDAPTGAAYTGWQVSVDDASAVTLSCTLTGPGAGDSLDVSSTCNTNPVRPELTTSGTYTLSVTATDAQGRSTGPESAAFTYDGTAPVVTFVEPQPTGPSSTQPTWSWTTSETSTTTCDLSKDGGAPTTVACSGGSYTASLDSVGTYTLTVTATDPAGNVSTSITSQGYAYDDVAPSVAIDPGGATRGSDDSVTWTVSLSDGLTGTCTLGDAPSSPCVDRDTIIGTQTTDGSITLTVTATDAAGNTSSATATYTRDTVVEFAVGTPAGPSSNLQPTWEFTTDETVTFISCVLTADGLVVAAGGTCGPSGYTPDPLAGPSGTSYVLQVTVDDGVNRATFTSGAYVLDTIPATLILQPAAEQLAVDNSTQPSWTFEGDTWSSPACRFTIVGGDGTHLGGACTSTGFVSPTLTGPSGTQYLLEVTATDAAGNVATASTTYTLDTEADTVVAVAPASTGNDTRPTFTFDYDTAAQSVACSLTDGTTTVTEDCVFDNSTLSGSFRPSSPLPDTAGTTWTFTVTVTDLAGNTSAASAPVTYLLDTEAEASTVSGPAAYDDDVRPVWTWTAEDGATVTCVLADPDGNTHDVSCTNGTSSPTTDLPPTSSTVWTLVVTVVDSLENETVLTFDPYELDTIADYTAGTEPATPGNVTTPQWTWTAEPGALVTCLLTGPDGEVFNDDCTTHSGFTAPELDATTGADYVLTVTIVDTLDNTTVIEYDAYHLDTVLELDVDGPTGPSPDRTPEWAFTGEPLVTLECTLVGPGGDTITGGSCDQNGYRAPPLTEDGDHVLTVRGVDAAGNDVTQTFTYDLDTLHFTIAGPTGPSPDRTPTWTFADEPYVSAHCVLTGPDGEVFSGPCTTTSSFTADQLPLTPGADYVLTVRVVDSIGNEGTLTAPAYRLDTKLPVATITVPDSPSRTVSVTWTVASDEPLLSATCELRRDGVVVLSLDNCPGSTVVSLPGDGRYDLVVTLVDLAGNRSVTTSTVLVHDATVPTAPVVSPATLTTNRTTATWTITAEGGTSVTTCRVLREGAVFADWQTCGGTFTLPLGTDGSYVLEVVSTDPVGPGPTTSVTYVLDTVAPAAPQLTGATGPAQGRTPSWTIGTDSGTTVECRVVRGGVTISDWASCAGTVSADLTALPDGAYVVEARATDAAGNVSAVGSSAAYVLDTTAPVAPVVTGPAGPSQQRAPRFTWTGEAGALAECLLSRDGVAVGGWTPCTSGYSPNLDRDGTWTLTVRLTDAAGNVSDAAASGGYVLDTTPPPAPIVTPPKTPGRDLAPSWGAVVETGATLECRLIAADGTEGAWTPCTMPHVTSLDGRPDGAYVLEVRATDVAGNVSAVGSGTYVLDTVAPAAAVITAPTSPSRSRTPAFTFTVEPQATTRCRLTSGATLITDFAACSSPTSIDLTGLPDGTYTLTVRVADAAGNPGPAATATYVLDTTGPAAPTLTLTPGSPSPARSVTWAFTYEPGSTLVCRLTFPTGAVREISSCASPLTIDLTGLPDGTYTLTVRAVDAAGNVGAVLTAPHVIDSTALAPPQVTGPTTPGSTRTPRWTISTGTTECRLTRGTTVLRDWATCAGSFTADLFGQPDGTYVLSVRSKDASGAVSAATTSRYVLDTTAPAAATVVPPPTPSTNRNPTWTIASSELGATAECRVLLFGSVLTDWAPCAVSVAGSPYSALDLTGRGDGTYTLVVRLADAAGNLGPETSSPYVLDTAAPVGVGVTGPASPGNDTTPTWTFTTAGTAQLECRLTSVEGVVYDWETCAGSYTADLTDLPDGTYTLAVRAVSEAGTPGPETTSAYVLSTVAPDGPTALALSGTKPTSNDRSPTWTFTLPSGTTATCTVVSNGRTVFDGPCTSPFTLDLSSASDGSYTLTVRSIDKAGTRSEPVSSTYVLDTVPTSPPVFTLTPGATGSNLDPQWRFTVVYDATAECRLVYEGAAPEWGTCTSPYTAVLTGRPDGRYVLEVRAVDKAGNSSAPRSSTYLLDRTAVPVATFTSTPDTPGVERIVTWTFSGPEGTSLECRLIAPDGTTAWAPCGVVAGPGTTSAQLGTTEGRYRLDLRDRRDGDYVLEVRVVDADGRVGSASRATYTLDTVAPEAPRFSDVPPAAGNVARPTWSWNATTDDRVECRLVRVDGAPITEWAPCESPYEARLTAQGSYALELRVIDAAGNVSPTTSSPYRYDTTAPATPVFTSRPPAGGADRTVTWTFAMPSDVTGATCTLTRGGSRIATGPCNGRYELNLAGQPDGTYTLTVRFTDAAGNVSRPASSDYALRTVGLGGPPRVDPPSAPTSPGTSTPRTPTGPTGPGRGGTGAGPVAGPSAGGSTSRPDVPIVPTDEDVPSTADRPSTFTQRPAGEEAAAAPEPAPRETTRARNPLLADPLPLPAPELLRDAVTSTITRPTLPLALLAIVILFLLAQNRIDRRDPKLASAPVEAEPELDFTTIVRRPGGALS